MEKFSHSKFANLLKELRTKHKLSIGELCEILNIPEITLRRWEAQDCNGLNCKHLFYLAKHFKVTADYLLGLQNPNDPTQ